MNAIVKIVVAFVLLAVAGHCVFGFLATYEPPGSSVLRVAYGVVGLACLAGAAGVLLRKGRV